LLLKVSRNEQKRKTPETLNPSNQRNLKPWQVLVWKENILKMDIFENKDVTCNNHVISLTGFSSNTNPKELVIVAFSLSPAQCGWVPVQLNL